MKDASQKADLRNVFLTWKPYIKFNPFLKRNNINASSFSKFLKSDLFNYEIELSRLNELYMDICETMDRLKVT